jgi:hypothetical protein
VLLEVARTTGQPFAKVMRDPYAFTLYQYVILQDLQRLEAVIAEAERLDLGGLVHYAFNAPGELRKRTLEFQGKLGLFQDRETVLERAQKMITELANTVVRPPE